MRSFLLVLVLASLAGCGSNAGNGARDPKSLTRVQRVSGKWIGKNDEDPKNPRGGASSNFLAESLGGYTLDLLENGDFSASWRGLTKDGTWSINGDALELKPAHVLGKTRAEAINENKTTGKDLNDLNLFDTQNSLLFSSGDTVLTLKAAEKDAETVVFSRD